MKLDPKGLQSLNNEISKIKLQLERLDHPQDRSGKIAVESGFMDAEYREPAEERDRLLTRLAQLENDVNFAEIIEPDSLPEDVIKMGDYVTMKTELNGEVFEETYQLVSVPDMPGTQVSISSAIGSAIYCRTVGDTLSVNTPAGVMNIEIIGRNQGLGR